jgi:endogenous inhibitor of DNA gyrase (YacG/DUF329 family)
MSERPVDGCLNCGKVFDLGVYTPFCSKACDDTWDAFATEHLRDDEDD